MHLQCCLHFYNGKIWVFLLEPSYFRITTQKWKRNEGPVWHLLSVRDSFLWQRLLEITCKPVVIKKGVLVLSAMETPVWMKFMHKTTASFQAENTFFCCGVQIRHSTYSTVENYSTVQRTRVLPPHPQHQRDEDILEKVQCRPTVTMKRLGHLSCEKKWRELGLLNLKKRRLREII